MPIYTYACDTCEMQFDKKVPLAEYADPQACQDCGGVTRKVILAVALNFPGDGWASKNGRLQAQMAKKNAKLNIKQEEMKRDAPAVTLVPNVGGERVGSWGEARKLAESQGKNTGSYDAMVKKENKKT